MMRALDRLRTLRVSDVMSKHVVEVAPEQRAEEVADLFVSKDVSSAPVIDRNRHCVGILSAVDFLRRKSDSPAQTVADLMSQSVRSIGANESLLKAAHLMCAKHVHRLPVLGDDHRVVGVVSTMDFVAAVLNVLDESDAAQFSHAES